MPEEDYNSAFTGTQIDAAVAEVKDTGNAVAARLSGNGAPTASTAGRVGDFYTDTSDFYTGTMKGRMYRCISASNGTYVWAEVGDMQKSVYDPDNRGYVDYAAHSTGADTALRAQNSDKLGGQLPSYYALASDLGEISEKIDGYDGHIADDDIHVTVSDKTTWNGKSDTSINLLDNADWGYGVVNQRGNASYSITDGTWDSSISGDYTVDRWITHGSITITNPTASAAGYISMANGAIMKQRIEIIPSALLGRKCCVAVDIGSTVYSGTIQFPSAATGASAAVTLGGATVVVGFDSGTYTLCDISSVSGVPYINMTAASAVNIRRVWLELGNVCHMETTPPKSYAENLAVCQRYFISIGSVFTAFGFVSSGAKTYYMFVPILAPLRSTPAATLSGWRGRKTVSPGYLAYTGNTYTAPTTISANYSPGAALVRITDTINTAVDENNQVAQYEFSRLEISAEL